ncbi:hypothetical protein [Syntrophomonas wolfei]|jgi:hypothetical protein|uniref:hypothetical protein n=1 Tax=Syntrophomonas wolfei TaxID=863 RepID=UPI0023F0ECFC|nr:hypothetical protein [Syntrophomonas wolfei]
MDSWFTTEPMNKAILDKHIHTIGMVKQLKQRYSYNSQVMTLSELRATLPTTSRSEIIESRYVQTKRTDWKLSNDLSAAILC